jgi:hypothetical protein
MKYWLWKRREFAAQKEAGAGAGHRHRARGDAGKKSNRRLGGRSAFAIEFVTSRDGSKIRQGERRAGDSRSVCGRHPPASDSRVRVVAAHQALTDARAGVLFKGAPGRRPKGRPGRRPLRSDGPLHHRKISHREMQAKTQMDLGTQMAEKWIGPQLKPARENFGSLLLSEAGGEGGIRTPGRAYDPTTV